MTRRSFPILLILLFYSCSLKSQEESIVNEIPGRASRLSVAEIDALDSVDIDFQLRGHCYAYSSNKNARKSRGEYRSPNIPIQVSPEFPRKGIYLTINKSEFVRIDSNSLGCKLYLVNTSDTAVTLKAADSRLYMVAEVLNKRKKWVPISYLQSSWCGNSYHKIVLDTNEFWEFSIPVFKGNFKTKLRYTVLLGEEHLISSNIIDVSVNKNQLNKKNRQGYNSRNLMDPYDE